MCSSDLCIAESLLEKANANRARQSATKLINLILLRSQMRDASRVAIINLSLKTHNSHVKSEKPGQDDKGQIGGQLFLN